MKLDTGTLLERAESRMSVDIQPLSSHSELLACVRLQRLTWGESFGEVAPPSILKIAQRLGGVAVGAFDARGTLVGFVFGMTGVENGAIVHWSDMLAVLPEAQNKGIGRRLKEYQRRAVAKVGAKVIYWTFDPLVARNAHLNVNVLGVRVTEYVENMYGESSSPVHRGVGTDRLIVAWPVDDAELAKRRGEIARISSKGASQLIRVEIPRSVEELQASDVDSARSWRERTRAAFQRAFASGYAIHGFTSDAHAGRAYYLLTR